MITGTGFVPDSYVLWNGNHISPQYFSSTSIEALLVNNNAPLKPATVTVQVVNPVPGGGASSPVTYTIGPPAPLASFFQTLLDFGPVAEGQTNPSQETLSHQCRHRHPAYHLGHRIRRLCRDQHLRRHSRRSRLVLNLCHLHAHRLRHADRDAFSE
jgi:hypothetical protein